MVVNGTMVIRTLHYLYMDVTGVMGASDDDVIAARASDSSFSLNLVKICWCPLRLLSP